MITAYPINFISNGGGGGGDWTSAEVTFISSAKEYTYAGLCVYEGEYGGVALTVRPSENMKIVIPLYKGIGYIRIADLDDIDFTVMPSTTGSIQLDNEQGYVVTGNGSVTMAGLYGDN